MNCATAGCYAPVHAGSQFCMRCHKEQDGYAYGLDADLKKKQAAKYDVNREREALWWVGVTVGQDLGQDFQGALKDGAALCQVYNTVKPANLPAIRMTRGRMPFVHRENIEKYLNACRDLGVRDTDLFQTIDLYEGQNLGSVVDSLFALSAAARQKGYTGQVIGSKLAEKNVRNFSPAVLAKSKGVMSRQTQGSYGYQPEKEKNTDHIIKDPNALKASSTPSRQTLGSYGYQDSSAHTKLDKIIHNVDHIRSGQAGAGLQGSRKVAPARGGGVVQRGPPPPPAAARMGSAGGPAGGSAGGNFAKFCGECGAKNVGNGAFCPNCGTGIARLA